MTQKLETQMYPTYLFIAEEENGQIRWYATDPMKAGANDAAIVDPGRLMVDMLGHCTKANPIVIKIGGAILERSFAFDASIPDQMRKGTLAAHIRDYEGNYVEILPMRSNDPDFPLNGAVLDEAGEPICFRKFSFRGACADDNPNHSLVVFHGLLKMESDKDLGAMAEEAAKEEGPANKRRSRRSQRKRNEEEEQAPLGGGDEPAEMEGNLFENL